VQDDAEVKQLPYQAYEQLPNSIVMHPDENQSQQNITRVLVEEDKYNLSFGE
jgi:hypothetical protein